MQLKGRRKIVPYLFISPFLVGLFVFTLFPLLFSLFMSVHDWNIMGGKTFVGFGNFSKLFQDDNFAHSLNVTFKYSALLVPLNVGIALVLALLLSAIRRGAGFFKTVFYLPSIISGVALALIWTWILKDKGILNHLLTAVGLDAVPWLRSPGAALWAVVLTTIWAQGAMMMVFLSGIKAIPSQVNEAAMIDGATGFTRFRTITMPLLSPTIVYNLIMAIIASFQQLTVVMNLTNGGPLKSTYLYALFVYENAFKKFQLGYAAASAWVMFLIILALTGGVLYLSKKWTYYEV
ncbi:sugar ABC transporter permease [Cohnella sp. LGH]|uniref:Multiple sugar transport system permease protein n=1 Tax=Cohnella phaseoli TaxID=456490 RepID=A0A3D9HZR6_9BACL|nr:MULTISPECIES: sugar ABC transporter permease [Cohnella]QTH41862.1 sugar ABC transporter permease [Cohnella sp. LGH]RED54861.1 multiple sugar transport system permease protein [Cohnella phaseoli]